MRLLSVLGAVTAFAALVAGSSSVHPSAEAGSFAHRRAEWKHTPAIQHALIRKVNREPNSTWTAGVNSRFEGLTMHDAASLCGVSPHWMSSYDSRPSPLLRNAEDVFPAGEFDDLDFELFDGGLPTNYDVRDQWSATCPIVNDITDQSSCGSCWAVSAASAMSDRNCITSNGTFNAYIASADILSCCGYSCGSCSGGQPDKAWSYWMKSGAVTGGHYGSKQGCWPYPMRPCDHGSSGSRPACGGEGGSTPYCTRQCRGGSVSDWAKDKNFGYSGYRVGSGRNVAAIMKELYTRGSVQATFYVYSDFLNYKSGIYTYRAGQMLGGHAVKLIGWGVDEKTKVPYWTIANSWNTDWGDNGYFKIRRGTNEAQIEELLFAGIPTVPTPTPSPPTQEIAEL